MPGCADAELAELAAITGTALRQAGWRVVTAESCTGGWVAQMLTAIPGSSAWFDCGFVTYSNQAKQDLLGVRIATLQQHGAVSAATVREMATGALARAHARIAVAISGIAGPDGGSAEKPVGTVWLAWATDAQAEAVCRHFDGERDSVRRQAVYAALQGIMERTPPV